MNTPIARYESLRGPNPLASPQKDNLCKALAMNEIARVLDPGSHSLTEDDLTKPMVTKCLELIKKHIEGNLNSELVRLKDLRKRKKSGKIIDAATSKTTSFTFNETKIINQIGRAAARPDSWVVDEAEQEATAAIQNFACVHVTGNTFDPVARCGQCILLSGLDDVPEEGDLVVGEISEHEKFLRRISFNDESAFLYSINPLKITAPLQIDRNDLSVHRVIGVLYEPCRHCSAENLNGNEWHPCENIDPSYFENMKMIAVEGNSLEPIARKGQNVLVKEGVMPQGGAIETGGLAVIETNDESIGNEIKRVYPNVDIWILVSPNPLEAYAPHVVPVENIKKIWPLKGVIFESNLEE